MRDKKEEPDEPSSISWEDARKQLVEIYVERPMALINKVPFEFGAGIEMLDRADDVKTREAIWNVADDGAVKKKACTLPMLTMITPADLLGPQRARK